MDSRNCGDCSACANGNYHSCESNKNSTRKIELEFKDGSVEVPREEEIILFIRDGVINIGVWYKSRTFYGDVYNNYIWQAGYDYDGGDGPSVDIKYVFWCYQPKLGNENEEA